MMKIIDASYEEIMKIYEERGLTETPEERRMAERWAKVWTAMWAEKLKLLPKLKMEQPEIFAGIDLGKKEPKILCISDSPHQITGIGHPKTVIVFRKSNKKYFRDKPSKITKEVEDAVNELIKIYSKRTDE